MKRFILLLCLAGCVQSPATPPAPTPSVADASDLGEALARWVESGACDSTDEFFKVAGQAATSLGVTVNLGAVPTNQKMTDALKAQYASLARSLK